MSTTEIIPEGCLPPGVEPVWNDIEVSLNALAVIRHMLAQVVAEEERLKDIFLACDEIVANIAVHSRAVHAGFFCLCFEGRVFAGFRDDGVPFDPTSAEKQAREFDAMEFGGMGLYFICQMVEEWHYFRVAGENLLLLIFAEK